MINDGRSGQTGSPTSPLPTVSVIVAARNEKEHIYQCLDSLCNLDYPREKIEIIVVDDRSTDGTWTVILDFLRRFPWFRGIHIADVPPNIAPKKNAIAEGISISTGEWIATTDADCTVPPSWVSGLMGHVDSRTGCIAGFSPSRIPAENGCFLPEFARLDTIGIAAFEGGFLELGIPLSCTGRNLAYRKDAFIDVNGFREIGHHISGDDDLLMHEMVRKGWRCGYAWNPETIVLTHPPDSLEQFLHARIRHSSKSFSYPPLTTIILVSLYMIHVLPLVMLMADVCYLRFPVHAIEACILKFFGDIFLLWRFANAMKVQIPWHTYPLGSLPHLLYVAVIPILGNLFTFRWKGERHRKSITRAKR
jgi:cellulose synthase/poly-beta-1,6-N-acetylglucosamine synthase-like glycosyltransferase